MFNPAPKPQKGSKPKKRIAIKSKDKYLEDSMYSVLSKWFKSSVGKCQVCNVKTCQDVHHKMGRIGYADKWAKILEITLTMDIRYWLAVCRDCHIKIENNPDWAKENKYSLLRSNDV